MRKNALTGKTCSALAVPNTAYARYFIGNSYLNPLTEAGKCPVFLANVTFEPGCRNNWHIHHARSGGGQLLICTAGEGWYQEEGKEAVSLTPAWSSPSRRRSNIGTARKRTAGSATSPSRCPAKRLPTSGVSRWTIPPTMGWSKEDGCGYARPAGMMAQGREESLWMSSEGNGSTIWYYFTVQLEQIFRWWVLGMLIGSAVSVFAKDSIHRAFRALKGKRLGVLESQPPAHWGSLPHCACTARSPSPHPFPEAVCGTAGWRPL